MTIILIWIFAIGITVVVFTDDQAIKFGYAVLTIFMLFVWTLLTIFF